MQKGKVHLYYNFENMSNEPLIDWTPTSYESGIIISEKGMWLHKALFLKDLEVHVDCP